MSLVISRPQRPTLTSRFIALLRQYFDVRRARAEVERSRRQIAMAVQMLAISKRASEQYETSLEKLRSENKELKEQLILFTAIDPNAKCPGCGAMEGTILAFQNHQLQTAYIEHTCKQCKFKWPEETVYKDAGKAWKPEDGEYMVPVPPGGVRRG